MNWFSIIPGKYLVISIFLLIVLQKDISGIFTPSEDSNESLTEDNAGDLHNHSGISTLKITGFAVLKKGNQLEINTHCLDDFSNEPILKLAYNQKNISIAFGLVDASFLNDIVYAYILEGFDEDWCYCSYDQTATYIDLPSGEYIFRVKAYSTGAAWNEEAASFGIVIAAPWWQSSWAYLTYVLLIGVGIYSFRQSIVSRVHLKHQLQMEHNDAERLRELDSMKSRFFANISHEFRTPLTLIMGPVDQVLAETTDQTIVPKLHLVKSNANKLHSMINQLLDISRLESANMKLQSTFGDYVSFIRFVVSSFQSWADRKRIILIFDSQIGHLPGYFDPEKLENILCNLLSNAMKFTPDGGTVVLTLKTEKEWVVITVRDTGGGIAQHHIEHIFDRFYRIDDSHYSEGTGIGLAYTKNLIDLHRGTIAVESELGKGSVFTVRLPRIIDKLNTTCTIKEESDKHAVSPADDGHVTAGQRKIDNGTVCLHDESKPLILIVEDNPDVRTFTRAILEKEYRFIESADGRDGIERAIKEIPDLIISDVMMPKLDGYELCKRIKTDQRTSHIPVILLTAKASTQNKLDGLETGADDYIIKPFESCELQIRVKNLIEQRRLLRERFRREITLQPRDIAITPTDERFLNRAIEIVEMHMSDQLFTAEGFADEMYLSRMQFHRKMRALTDLSPWQFVRRMRVRRAAELLKNRAGNIGEIANRVGYDNPSKFSHAFREEFGMTPSTYQVELYKNENSLTLTPFL